MTTTIIGVSLENRLEKALEFQKIVTDFGCDIKTRIGLHSFKNQTCSDCGIVLLEVFGTADLLTLELSKHWEIQTMVFE